MVEVKPDAEVAIAPFKDLVAKGRQIVLTRASCRPAAAGFRILPRRRGASSSMSARPTTAARELHARVPAPRRPARCWPTGSAPVSDLEAMAALGADCGCTPAAALCRCAAPRGDEVRRPRSSPRRSSRTPARRERTDTGVIQIQRRAAGVHAGPARPRRRARHRRKPGAFGAYVPYRTWVPRPVAGTAGLVASSWHPASEQSDGSQIQNRFEKGRRPADGWKDMSAWTAVRVVGKAATRTDSAERSQVEAYLRDPQFSIAAFKGQKLTFRPWNPAAPAADLFGRRPRRGLDLAAGGLFAPGLRTRHARRRPAGDQECALK